MVSPSLASPSSSTASARLTVCVFRSTGRSSMASQSINIRNLYKIFGPRARDFVEPVMRGMSKTELNREHGHVLGLKDINITIPGGGITVIMGLSGSGKSTLIRHINRLIDPTSGEVRYGDVDVCRMDKEQLRQFRQKKTAMVFQKF